MDSDKDIAMLQKRFQELADKAYARNMYTFTGFLSLPEQDAFWQCAAGINYMKYELWGGSPLSERKILRFGSEEELGFQEAYPIVCVHIKPLLHKFADDFSHRDFLGALMNLGIERGTLGDIYVNDREGYLYCLQSMADFICENLTKIKHTNVTCTIEDLQDICVEKEPEQTEFTVASERIDGVIARVYHLSRGNSLTLFRDKKIYVNGRLKEQNSLCLKEGDAVTVRGYGKFIYKGIRYRTKKEKLCIQVQVYR